MWPSAREALEVVVREAVVARQESAELRLSAAGMPENKKIIRSSA
jgi:hypothetical protein